MKTRKFYSFFNLGRNLIAILYWFTCFVQFYVVCIQIKTMSSAAHEKVKIFFCVASSNRCKSVHKSEGQKSVSHKKIGFDHPSYRTSPNKEQFLHEKPILSPKTSYCIINNHKAVHSGLLMLKFWNWVVNKKRTVKAKIDIFLDFVSTNF